MFTRVFFAIAALVMAAPLVAGPAPRFALRKTDGSLFQASDHLGKQVMVIDFWASWCGSCSKYLKKLQEIQNKHSDVLVLAIAIDDSKTMSQVGPYVKNKGYTFTTLLDPESEVCKMFNPGGGVPFTVVIDKKGEISYSHSGYVSGDEVSLMKAVESARGL